VKVLLVNKFYYRRAGAETALFNLAELLESRGHVVVPFSTQHPENLPSRYEGDFASYSELDGSNTVRQSVRATRNVLYSREARRKIERIIEREKPDVAHLHNIYHHLSPSILGPLRKHSIPTVMTLHDYKVVCPAYTLYTGGQACERCRGGKFASAVFRRCSKGRLGRSALLAAEAYLHGPVLRSYKKVDLFLSPSRFLLDKVREMGFDRPAAVVPNVFFAGRFLPATSASGRRIVYAGRLTQEKGVATFLRAVRDIPSEVRIIGTGPDEAKLREIAAGAGSASIRFLGHLPFPELLDEIRDSLFVVCPSEWYENLPYAVLEAFALGKPVVAARIGGLPELVRDGETGLFFEPGDAEEMKLRMKTLLDDPAAAARMGKEARRFVESEFVPDRAYNAVMAAYGRAAGKTS
jgi:glycosyltransferase involved in cell wall biosynthesis